MYDFQSIIIKVHKKSITNSMDFLWTFYGLFMDFLWTFMDVYGILWTFFYFMDFFMDVLNVYGFFMDFFYYFVQSRQHLLNEQF